MAGIYQKGVKMPKMARKNHKCLMRSVNSKNSGKMPNGGGKYQNGGKVVK
jgi:hypothetical protein